MWLIKYNKQFDTLICVLNNQKTTSFYNVNNITILVNDDNVVGFNIANPKIDKNASYKLIDKNLIQYLNEEILKLINQKNRLKEETINMLKKLISITTDDKTFTICKIIECEDIQGTHLKKCFVDIKRTQIQIITNAKNAKKNLITVVALPGTFLNDGTYINESKINGYESFGMFCSSKTLNIKNNDNEIGIIELNLNNKIGEPFFNI